MGRNVWDLLGNSCLLYTALRYGCYGNWASFFFSQQRVPYENIELTEDNNYSRNDYYIDPPDSDSAIPLMRADGYDRLVYLRTLDSSTRFGFKFFRIILKNGHPGKLHSTFFPLKS